MRGGANREREREFNTTRASVGGLECRPFPKRPHLGPSFCRLLVCPGGLVGGWLATACQFDWISLMSSSSLLFVVGGGGGVN
jgi:hypothetical protein